MSNTATKILRIDDITVRLTADLRICVGCLTRKSRLTVLMPDRVCPDHGRSDELSASELPDVLTVTDATVGPTLAEIHERVSAAAKRDRARGGDDDLRHAVFGAYADPDYARREESRRLDELHRTYDAQDAATRDAYSVFHH